MATKFDFPDNLDPEGLRSVMELLLKLVEKKKVRVTSICISPFDEDPILKDSEDGCCSCKYKNDQMYQQNWTCHLCPGHQSFKNEKELFDHCGDEHTGKVGDPDEVSERILKKHECKFCGKIFARNVQVMTHLRVHTKEKPFECPGCQKLFAYRCTLQRHQRMFHADL